MPTPRKTIQALELNGALKHNPGRYKDRLNAPTSSLPLGEPPAHLGPREREAWKKIVSSCPAGILTGADEAIVELTAVLWVESAQRGATAAARGQLCRCLQELGMTPAARSRVSVAPNDDEPNIFRDI